MPIVDRKYLGICAILFLGACSGSDEPLPTPLPTPTLSPENTLDVRALEGDDGLLRLYGSTGNGRFGVPVAGGKDMNGDGNNDFAMASMISSPNSRTRSGQVYLVLGDGNINASIDTAESNPSMLTIIGDGDNENTGSEIWMDDISGDGLADLLIARQNYSLADRIGAGALTIVFGSSALTSFAADNDTLDLRSPPAELKILTLVGPSELDRLGIWMRTGDVDGDSILDFAVGADQSDTQGANSGQVFIFRGGSHLNINETIDLNSLSSSNLRDFSLRVLPPANSTNFHLGATLNLADLDGNGRAELIVAAALQRAGASLRANNAPNGSAEGSGGSPYGRLYILWDDNYPSVWEGQTITLDDSVNGSLSVINGASTELFTNEYFGEEILGGLDYDGDNAADLFVGDITGNTAIFSKAGLGFVFFNAQTLKNQQFSLDNIPDNISLTTILGTEPGSISSDTALHGDFDNDGIDDLTVASPHMSPNNRNEAGAIHILWGQTVWPPVIDLSPGRQPASSEFNLTNIIGAWGGFGADLGDTLGYSAATGDMDNDGFDDLIVNEMVGNGISAGSTDAGNLIMISGAVAAAYR